MSFAPVKIFAIVDVNGDVIQTDEYGLRVFEEETDANAVMERCCEWTDAVLPYLLVPRTPSDATIQAMAKAMRNAPLEKHESVTAMAEYLARATYAAMVGP